jgi:AAA+ ATPase superfamily predicted ATPase
MSNCKTRASNLENRILDRIEHEAASTTRVLEFSIADLRRTARAIGIAAKAYENRIDQDPFIQQSYRVEADRLRQIADAMGAAV